MSHTQTSKCDNCGKEVTYAANVEGDVSLNRKEVQWFTVSSPRGNREMLFSLDACSTECVISIVEKEGMQALRSQLDSKDQDIRHFSLSVFETGLPAPKRP